MESSSAPMTPIPLPFPRPLSLGHHLVADPALLYHIEPLWQSCVELAALVLHCVHHHRALGAPGQQQVCRLQAVLEAPVLSDVHVVLKSPAICKKKIRLQPHRCDIQFPESKPDLHLTENLTKAVSCGRNRPSLLSEMKCKATQGYPNQSTATCAADWQASGLQ